MKNKKDLPLKTRIIRAQYGTFYKYMFKNKQQTQLLSVTHGFALLWLFYGVYDSAGFFLSILGFLVPGMNWLFSWGSWQGWRAFV